MHVKILGGEPIVIVGSQELYVANMAIRSWIEERDKNECFYCSSTDDLVLDHLIPVSRGGGHNPDNLVLACNSCNTEKDNKLLPTAELLAHQRLIAGRNYKRAILEGYGWPTSPLLPGHRFVRLPSCPMCKAELTIHHFALYRSYYVKCTTEGCKGKAKNFSVNKFCRWLTERTSLKFWVDKD